MMRVPVAGAALIAAAAAWLSQGSLAFAAAGGSRIGLLPLSISAFALALLAVAFVLFIARRGGSMTPAWLLLLIVIPWLPIPLPPVLLMWSSRMGIFVACAAALAMIVSLPWHATMFPRGAPTAAVLAFAICAIAAWQTAASRPGGDEPSYLVITQSLLLDHDLKIENNHRRGDYRAYFPGELPPDFIQRGRDGQIYSIHAPGISVIVAPAFAIAGYRGAVVLLLCLAALSSALAWQLAWLITGDRAAAWFGWAAAILSTTAIFQSFSIYPDGVGGLLVLTGIWAIVRAGREARDGTSRMLPWLLHGAALAMLPWLHSRFAILAGTIGALVLLRLPATRDPAAKAVAFLAVPAVSALAWIAFFIAIYGRPDPTAPYGTSDIGSFAYIPSGITGILFDQRFGALAYSPVLAFAIAGLVVMLRRPPYRRLALELLFIVVPYMLAFSNYAMWWGGASAPARFLMPIVPALAIPAAVAWTAIERRATRATALGSLAFSLIAVGVVVFAADGRLAYNTRDGFAQWLDWLNRSVQLSAGVPVWFRRGDPAFFSRSGDLVFARDIAIWMLALVGAWLAVRRVDRTPRLRNRGVLAAVAAAAFAVAAMAATTVLWTLHGAEGAAADEAQFALLRRISREPRFIAFHLDPPSAIDARQLAAALRIEAPRSTARGCAGNFDRPLFSLPPLPAGRYRLRLRAQNASGLLLIGIGCDQFSLVTEPLTAPPRAIDLDFPVDIRRLMVRGDEEARQTVRSLAIEPLSLVPADARLSSASARHGVRYGTTSAFFLDDALFAEPESFWVGGSRSGSVVLKPDEGRAAATLLLRNAPVQNRLQIRAGGWRDDLQLGPGEERRVEIPLDTARGATLITFTSSSGFRPSDVDPKSRDGRFLGVWVKLE